LVVPATVFDDYIDEHCFDEHEYDCAEEEQAVPEKIDLTSEIGMRNEGGVGMCFVAGHCREGECGKQRVGCEPPEAVRAFHAKKILSRRLGMFHLRRRTTLRILLCST